jgi:hypothetical protein
VLLVVFENDRAEFLDSKTLKKVCDLIIKDKFVIKEMVVHAKKE